jgi:hypothetical protein
MEQCLDQLFPRAYCVSYRGFLHFAASVSVAPSVVLYPVAVRRRRVVGHGVCEPWAVLIEALTPGHDHPPRHQHRRVLADLRLHSGQTIIWHNGQTTGYTAFLGLNLQHHKAVVVCSDVARVTDNLGNQLLT